DVGHGGPARQCRFPPATGRRHEPGRPSPAGGARRRGGHPPGDHRIGRQHRPARRRVRGELRDRTAEDRVTRRQQRPAEDPRRPAGAAGRGPLPGCGVESPGRAGRRPGQRRPLARLHPPGRGAGCRQHDVLPAVRRRRQAGRAEPVLADARRLRRGEPGHRSGVRQPCGHRPRRRRARGAPADRDAEPGRHRAGQGHPHGAAQGHRSAGLRRPRPGVAGAEPQAPRRRPRAQRHRVGAGEPPAPEL
ncbi:MAG: hypothetical protein AVDCRST_MAG52-1461, partial [uncultured Blastococcus sp.]